MHVDNNLLTIIRPTYLCTSWINNNSPGMLVYNFVVNNHCHDQRMPVACQMCARCRMAHIPNIPIRSNGGTP